MNIREQLRGLGALEGPFPAVNFETAPESPQALFLEWLQTAIAAGIAEPHAMTLSTVDPNGYPDARVLILKNIDDRGWHFAISKNSPKGRHIAAQPRVALTFYWQKLGRQVRVCGTAVPVSAQESQQDFVARSLDARAGVLLDKQSALLANPQDIAAAMPAARERLLAQPDLVAPTWCVYAVAPLKVEFWQGATDRSHQRLCYERARHDDSWLKQRLWP